MLKWTLHTICHLLLAQINKRLNFYALHESARLLRADRFRVRAVLSCDEHNWSTHRKKVKKTKCLYKTSERRRLFRTQSLHVSVKMSSVSINIRLLQQTNDCCLVISILCLHFYKPGIASFSLTSVSHFIMWNCICGISKHLWIYVWKREFPFHAPMNPDNPYSENKVDPVWSWGRLIFSQSVKEIQTHSMQLNQMKFENTLFIPKANIMS